MQEGSPCAQELRSGGRGGCCVPRWSWRLPRVTPGEARGEGRGLAQGSQAREMQGCWAVPGRGGVWGGRPRRAPRGPAAPGAGFLPALRSAAPASLVPLLPRPTAPALSPVPRSALASLQAPPAAWPRPVGVLCASRSLYQGTFQRRDRTVR